MFLLDTNVVSELRKSVTGRANRGVVDWASSIPSGAMFLSVISAHELELGVLLAERSDRAKGRILRSWLSDTVFPAFDGRVLPIDASVAVRAATFHVPDPAPYRDAFIGATAAVHALTLVTRNGKDFERFRETNVLNPWTENV
jgi:toxin FitB